VIDADDVMRFIVRDGPFFVALAVAIVCLSYIGRVYRSYRDNDQERMGLYIAGVLQSWMFIGVFFAYTYCARVFVGREDWSATLFELGLTSPISPTAMTLWTGWLLLTWAGIAWFFTVAQKALGSGPTRLRLLMQPRTVGETAVWSLLVAPTAGICEEIFFRGYVVSQLLEMGSDTSAIVISSVAFGLLHFSQGVTGILATGLMGATAAWMVVTTGSIWPAIVAHTFYNMAVPFLFQDPDPLAKKSA
jgi:membrane protease YdiL (CAAX protease family)